MKRLNMKLGIIIGIVFGLLILSARLASAQEIVVAEGDTLIVKVVGSVIQDTLDPFQPPDLPAHQDTLAPYQDTVRVVVGDTTPPQPGGRMLLADDNGVLVARWTDGNGREHRVQLGPNASGSPLSGSYWLCANDIEGATNGQASCNSIRMGVTQINFRIPNPVPMKDGLMVQAVFPLDDIRPIEEYVATLLGGN